MTFVCIALVLALAAQTYFGWKEREKLIRRIQSPHIVQASEVVARPKPMHVSPNDDAAYLKLMEERGQIAKRD